MEILKLSFDAEILGKHKELLIEVPYQDGNVATSEFCPTELLSGNVPLMAALRGESLDIFMADCKRQLKAMAKAEEAKTEMDCHIAGLMAAVMNHLSHTGTMEFGDLLQMMDCFSLLLKANGFSHDEIKDIYPRVTRTIIELYPENIINCINI